MERAAISELKEDAILSGGVSAVYHPKERLQRTLKSSGHTWKSTLGDFLQSTGCQTEGEGDIASKLIQGTPSFSCWATVLSHVVETDR